MSYRAAKLAPVLDAVESGHLSPQRRRAVLAAYQQAHRGHSPRQRDPTPFDDFGVAASPTTGLASIVYSDDQFRAGNANNPNPPACTAGTTNTGSCDHTAFATQLAGPGIYTAHTP
ncbi:MAG: hypothetical protein ACR2P2_01105 [Nakamurella sp.]